MALCFMGNHFHFVLETPQANLVAGMQWFLGTYTGRFNRRHQLFGHLFSGRYKALIVDGSGTDYFRTVCDYVHLNPVRAKLVRPQDPLKTWRWSSYPEYLKSPRQRWPWLRVDRLLGRLGIPQDTAAGRRFFERQVEERRAEEDPQTFQQIRRGWCLGDEAFRKELLEQMDGGFGAEHYGEERRAGEEERAELLVQAGLRKARWQEADLGRTRKGEPVKVKLARQLREQTTMTHEWIAHRLEMGSKSNVSNLVYSEVQRTQKWKK
jgi:putative transposase